MYVEIVTLFFKIKNKKKILKNDIAGPQIFLDLNNIFTFNNLCLNPTLLEAALQ